MAVDINIVSPEQLTESAGIKPEVAMAICEYRDDNGGFMDMNEVADVPGVDEETIQALQSAGVKVGAAADMEGGAM